MTTQSMSLRSLQSYGICFVMAWLTVIGVTAPVALAQGAALSPTEASDAGKGQNDIHSVSTDMVPIMTLLLNHDKIRFTIGNIPEGVRTITTSKDPEIVKTIRLHAREMKARVQQGNNIRPKDPIFIEIFRHHKEISDVITDIPDGVSEDETSKNPQVVLLIREHARVVAGFVREGLEATHRNTPLPKGYHPVAGGATDNGH